MKTLRIVYLPAEGTIFDETVEVDDNANIKEAIAKSPLLNTFPELKQTLTVGIYGEQKSLSFQPIDGDRIEVYRPLTISPTELRKLKARKAAEKRLNKNNQI